ncbi:hypothetical protein Tsp_04876, partial [Trichinella spiralis]|uniref:hypothetical protein n=1 Tax=Trichinella spiralis TaxID=6334 RepID=UPI0001EFE1F1
PTAATTTVKNSQQQANTRINVRYRKESGGQEHSYLFFSRLSNFLCTAWQMWKRIQEVALNRGYQGCFKITNYCSWIEIDPEDCRFVYYSLENKPVCSNIFIRTSTVDCWHKHTRHKDMDGKQLLRSITDFPPDI